MGQVMIMRRGGGGGVRIKPTAYSTVGGLPGSAADGAVAVITSTAIGNLTLDAVQPSTAATGDLWLKTDFLGRAAIQLSAKPLVKSYPYTAMQYISGAWAFVRVFVYHGSWLEIRAWLYDTGNQHTELGNSWAIDYLEAGYGTITFGASAITMTRTIAGSGVRVKKADLIDFTQFNTLKVVMKRTSAAATGFVTVYIFDGATAVASVQSVAWNQNEIRTIALDVSAINAARKLSIYVHDVCTFEVQQAWLE